jgi:SAM-dependent methyltransferase
MVSMTTTNQAVPSRPAHDWNEAGTAWGHRANDWSCLYEHYSTDVLIALYQRLAPGLDTSLLDIACGSGLAVRIAGSMGAQVAGIDAAAELIAIARSRTPAADLRVGSMFALPWPGSSFDTAVSVNGIWGGCEAALDEAFRVLRPGGLIGISFWGPGPPLDIREFFRVFAAHAPIEHRNSMRQLNDISRAGVAESMLEQSGFEVIERDRRTSVIEWPDEELAWRALSSVGPAVPALRTGDLAVIKRDVLEALEHCRDERGIYRTQSDHHFVIARKP